MPEQASLTRNAVTVRGEGPALLLAHGFGCDQAMWDPLERFVEGHRVIRYDLTGLGASDYHAYDHARHGSLDGHAKDLIQILEDADQGPVVAVGHSVSSIIVALAAIRRPDLFKGIVMLCPNPRYINDPPYEGGFGAEDIEGLLAAVKNNYQGWAGQLAGMVAGTDEASEATLNARFCRNDPAITQHFAGVTFRGDNRDDLAKITTPTLLIQTENDVIVPPAAASFVRQQIPHAESVEIPGDGHAPHMTRPQETADAILAFARGLHA